MKPQQFKEARQSMGLTLSQMAIMLGYEGTHAAQQVRKMESGDREIRKPQALLMAAYMDGYRPPDWPV